MTQVDFLFFLGAAFLGAAVVGWVCFLEVSYRLERQHRRAAPIRLGLSTARAAREIVAQPPTTADRSREQLHIARAEPKRKARAAQAVFLKAREATEPAQTPRRFYA